jgi:hypothetical protein
VRTFRSAPVSLLPWSTIISPPTTSSLPH